MKIEIYAKNNRENNDWNKIELNHDYVKNINKIIDEINEYKFKTNKYSVNKIQKLLIIKTK